jgi:hypothetical protein
MGCLGKILAPDPPADIRRITYLSNRSPSARAGLAASREPKRGSAPQLSVAENLQFKTFQKFGS